MGDPDDLDEVRWASIDETRELMPDMYGPVRQYLDELQRASDALRPTGGTSTGFRPEPRMGADRQ